MSLKQVSAILFLIVCGITIQSCFYKSAFSLDKKYKAPATANDFKPHKRNSLEWWYFASNPSDSNGTAQMFTIFKRNYFFSRTAYMVNRIVSNPISRKVEKERFFVNGKRKQWHKNDSIFLIDNDKKKIELTLEKTGLLRYTYIDNITTDTFVASAYVSNYINQAKNGYIDFGSSGKAGYLSGFKYNDTVKTRNNFIASNTWFDKQWNCMPLVKKTNSWKWLGAHFEDSSRLMLFYNKNGKENELVIHYAYTKANGENQFGKIAIDEWKELLYFKTQKNIYPIKYKITLVELKKILIIEAPDFDHEMLINPKGITVMTYWESPCKVATIDSKTGQVIKGVGFLEMTNPEKISKQ